MLCLTKYLFLTLHTKEEGNPSKYILLILQRSSEITAMRGSETTREVFPEELPDSSASARSAQGSEGKRRGACFKGAASPSYSEHRGFPHLQQAAAVLTQP